VHEHHVIILNHDSDTVTHSCAAPPSLCSVEVADEGGVEFALEAPAAYQQVVGSSLAMELDDEKDEEGEDGDEYEGDEGVQHEVEGDEGVQHEAEGRARTTARGALRHRSLASGQRGDDDSEPDSLDFPFSSLFSASD